MYIMCLFSACCYFKLPPVLSFCFTLELYQIELTDVTPMADWYNVNRV